MPRPEGSHWFEAMADHLGPAYLRYSFTKGTEQEVAFLVDLLGLNEGMRVLDVGCGPGRHALALAARGIEVLGVDISQAFIDLATAAVPEGHPASFQRLDARTMSFVSEFDAVISLCQGAFGLAGLDACDDEILAGIARALRPGGTAAVSAFSAYFQVRFLEDADDFDAATGVNHERTVLMDAVGNEAPAEMWTTCFTPRELRLLADRVGLTVDEIYSVTPGRYARNPPDLEHPEFLLVARLGS